jgi:hypothetical protein
MITLHASQSIFNLLELGLAEFGCLGFLLAQLGHDNETSFSVCFVVAGSSHTVL